MKNKNKKLGLPSAIAVCVGQIVATSALLSLANGVGLAGNNFFIPLAIVLVLNCFVALSFGELHRLMPEVDGGLGQYTLVGLGPVASIISNISAYVITMIFATSIELAMLGSVFHEFFPNIPAVIFSVITLLIIAGLNFMGTDIFSKTQNLVVAILIGSMIILGAIGCFKLGIGNVISTTEQTAPSVTGLGIFSLSATAFWLFIGCEFVIPVAKELKNPKRDVLLSMILGLVLLFFVQIIMGTGMQNYVDRDILATSDIPHMIYAENLLGNIGKIWIAIVALCAGISTLNAILPCSARVLMGMAEENMMPKIFSKTNRKGIPYIGICLIAI
ncbi:APC family permease, partial [uncultured Clostridium sp.]|uniref:APC family permease n=1 Tax=uncultured Clostridium sp. TaxID=59620 RepID=UPI0025EFB6A8